LRSLEKAASPNLLIGAKAVLVGGRVAAAITEATDVSQLRQTRLEFFCNQVFSIDVTQRLGVVSDMVKDELQEEVAKAIVESSAELLGVTVETVLPVVRIARIGFNLRQKLKAIKERHRRGDDDEMLDLADNLKDDDAAFEDVSTALKGLSDLLIKEQRSIASGDSA
jgi:hypothetical protein